MISRFLVSQAACWLLVLACSVNAAGGQSFEKDLKAYEKSKAAADKKMICAFDKTSGMIRNNREVPPETRNRHFVQIQNEKERFVKSNQLPESDDMLPATIAYLNELHEKRLKVQKVFDESLTKVIGDQAEFNRISAAKEQWQTQLPSRFEFGGGTEWHGNRTFSNGDTVDFHVHIHRMENGSFEGHLWQDAFRSGKSGWAYEGMMEGNAIVLRTTKMLQGNSRQLELRGFVIGRRLVFKTLVDGKPANDFASVGKK